MENLIYLAFGLMGGHLLVAIPTKNFKLTPYFVVGCLLLVALGKML